MIEINVRHAGKDLTAYIVEASIDGAGFIEQYFCGPVPELRRSAREHAEHIARIFANGCRYAGAEVQMTSCGEPLPLSRTQARESAGGIRRTTERLAHSRRRAHLQPLER